MRIAHRDSYCVDCACPRAEHGEISVLAILLCALTIQRGHMRKKHSSEGRTLRDTKMLQEDVTMDIEKKLDMSLEDVIKQASVVPAPRKRSSAATAATTVCLSPNLHVL